MNNRTEDKLKDLSGMQKAVSELLQQAWERGYKYGQAACEKPIEEEHELCVGDVVHTKLCSKENIVLGITKNGNQLWASVYTKDFDVPQLLPVENLIYTGKHVNVLGFFNKAFIDISGGKE